MYDGLFEIPTFEQVLALRARLQRELGHTIGAYPETKNPTHFQQLGLPLEPPLVVALRRHGLDRPDAPAFAQSFEATNLCDLHHRLGLRTPKVFLTNTAGSPFNDPTSYTEYLTPVGLADLSEYVRRLPAPDAGSRSRTRPAADQAG